MRRAAIASSVVLALSACWSESRDDMNNHDSARARAAERTDVVGGRAAGDRGGGDGVAQSDEAGKFHQTEHLSADRLQGVLRQSLLDDPALREVVRDVEIGVDRGVVTISGEVPYTADAQRVEAHVRRIAGGGYGVHNALEIGPRPGGGG